MIPDLHGVSMSLCFARYTCQVVGWRDLDFLQPYDPKAGQLTKGTGGLAWKAHIHLQQLRVKS